MMRLSCFFSVALIVIGGSYPTMTHADPPRGGDRFEVSSIKAVRPTLVNTIAALKKGDIPAAKVAFEAYDSGWNGIEMYINTRDKALYRTLEKDYQAKIGEELSAPNPDASAILAEAQAMLMKYDEAINMVENGAPLNPLFDDVARLRIVRSHLRAVVPALMAGDVATARKSFAAFDHNWGGIEDLIKARSAGSNTDIKKEIIAVEKALMPEKPDVDQVSGLVKDITDKYNAVVADITKDARGH